MKFRYRYDKLQEKLISVLHETEIKFRIRKDRTIEFAKKWYPDIDYELNEIRFDIFNKPVIYSLDQSIDIIPILHKLAEMNIPFIVENHDGEEKLIYDEMDVDKIVNIERELGINVIF